MIVTFHCYSSKGNNKTCLLYAGIVCMQSLEPFSVEFYCIFSWTGATAEHRSAITKSLLLITVALSAGQIFKCFDCNKYENWSVTTTQNFQEPPSVTYVLRRSSPCCTAIESINISAKVVIACGVFVLRNHRIRMNYGQIVYVLNNPPSSLRGSIHKLLNSTNNGSLSGILWWKLQRYPFIYKT